MDDSIYDPNQSSMITFTSPAANSNDQPTTFGPVLFDVLSSIADQVGGAQFLIGAGFRIVSTNSSAHIERRSQLNHAQFLQSATIGTDGGAETRGFIGCLSGRQCMSLEQKHVEL